MVYNLAQYLITQLPALTFVTNGFLRTSPSDAIEVIDNGGTEDAWYDRKELSVQVLVRNEEKTVGRVNAYSVYSLLRRRFGLTLPQTTVDGVVYTAIKTYQISPNQVPGYIGSDDRNLEMWSVNFRVITE